MTMRVPLLSPLIALLCTAALGLVARAQAMDGEKERAENAEPKLSEQVHVLIDIETGKPIANAPGRLFELEPTRGYRILSLVDDSPLKQTDAEGRVRITATDGLKMFVPDYYTPVLGVLRLRAALSEVRDKPFQIEFRRWRPLEVDVRANGMPAIGANVIVWPLPGEYGDSWLDFQLPDVFSVLEDSPRKSYQTLVDIMRGLRIRVEGRPDLRPEALYEDVSLQNLPKEWCASAGEGGRCRFAHVPDCAVCLMAWTEGSPIATRYIEAGGRSDKQLLEIPATASPKLRVRLRKDAFAEKVEFGISPVFGDGVRWVLPHGEHETVDYVFTGLEPGVFTLDTVGFGGPTLAMTEPREYFLEMWTGADLCQVTAAISYLGRTLSPTTLLWRRAEDLQWSSQKYDAAHPLWFQPGRYLFRVSETLQAEVELRRGETYALAFEMPHGEFSLKLDPRLAEVFGAALADMRVSAWSAAYRLIQDGFTDPEVVREGIAELAALRNWPRAPARVAVSGHGFDESFFVDLAKHPQGEVLVGKAELDETGEIRLKIAPGAQELLVLEVGRERTDRSWWTTVGSLKGDWPGNSQPLSRVIYARNPIEESRKLRVPKTGGQVSMTLPRAGAYQPTWLNLWASPGEEIEIDCANPAPGVIRLHLAPQRSYGVRVVDAKGWVWANHDVSDSEAIGDITFSIPCNFGRAVVQVKYLSDEVDQDGSKLELLAETIIDVASGTTEVPWSALKFGTMKLGYMEVVVAGIASPDRNTTAWAEEIGWASRFGRTWSGPQVTVCRLEGGRPYSSAELGWPVGVSNPEPARIFCGEFMPGEYRVIPWPGAPERLWRTVAIREAQTTRVELKLE